MTLSDLAISTTFIILYVVIAHVARKVLDKFTSIQGLVKELALETIAAAELCSTCFELIIVANNFGVATYAVILFLLTIWWSHAWGEATACPYTHIEDMIEGKTSPRDVALKTWAQLMGGCCVWRVVQFFWWLEFAQTHKGKAFEECSADLQVSPLIGAVIEGVATLLCRLASKALSENNPKHASIIDSFIGTSLVVAAFQFSGGYFNPVLATALQWSCHGVNNIDHIIVYWIGCCIGSIASIYVYRLPSVRKLLISEKPKEEKIE